MKRRRAKTSMKSPTSLFLLVAHVASAAELTLDDYYLLTENFTDSGSGFDAPSAAFDAPSAAPSTGPPCRIEHIASCSDDERALLERLRSMSLDELRSAAEEGEMKIAEVEDRLDEAVEELSERIEIVERERDKAANEVDAAQIALEEAIRVEAKRVKEFDEVWDRLEAERNEANAAADDEGLEVIQMVIEAKQAAEARQAADAKQAAEADEAFDADEAAGAKDEL